MSLSHSCRHLPAAKYLVLLLAVVAAVLLFAFNPERFWFWPKCPFKLLTGLDCPACGVQRFIHTALNGRFAEACRYNYFLLYALPYTFLVVLAYYLPQGKFKRKLTNAVEGKFAVYLYVVLFSLWLVVRNIMKI